MQTILLDDEVPAIKLLSVFVKKIPFLDLQLATTNAFEALEQLNKGETNLLFLDIEMPDITGVELLKSLKNPPLVVFTTAYEQYALEGYDLDIVDYLLKPIRFERFLKAANKAQKQFLPIETPLNTPQEVYLYVKADYQTHKIAFEDILYIEGLKDYVRIHTDKQRIMTRLNMKGILTKLPSEQFIRIHRSYTVAISKITAFQKSQVTIQSTALPIGESYRMKIHAFLK